MEKLSTLQSQITVFEKLPPPKWIIDNLIKEKTINIIAAPSNAGKTLLTTHLFCLLDEGGQFLHRTVIPQKTLYIDLELQSSMFFLRIKKQSNKQFSDNLYYTDSKIDIIDNDNLDKFIRLLKETGIQVLIIDSYSQLTVGSEENNNSQQAFILQQLMKIKNEGITLILIHHTRKEQNDSNLNINSLRGGSVIASGADTILMLTRQGTTMRLKQIKDRLIPSDKWLNVYFSFRENDNGIIEPITKSSNNIDNELSASIINLLKTQTMLSGNKIAELLHANRQNISDELNKLKEAGVVNTEPPQPRQGQRVKYFLNSYEEENNDTVDPLFEDDDNEDILM